MAKTIMTLGAKAAQQYGSVKATMTVDVKITRRFIWIVKLRYIWAVIRADMRSVGHGSNPSSIDPEMDA